MAEGRSQLRERLGGLDRPWGACPKPRSGEGPLKARPHCEPSFCFTVPPVSLTSPLYSSERPCGDTVVSPTPTPSFPYLPP